MKGRVEFEQIASDVPESSGIYEIHTHCGTPLKVGIAKNLKRRLASHFVSRQSGLKAKVRGTSSWSCPSEVVSKASILAKHLYFDRAISSACSLLTEDGRRSFLSSSCYIEFEPLPLELAKKQERVREQSGTFRYFGRVRVLRI
jgi:hypothetical protein